MSALTLTGASKRFGKIVAVDHVDLAVGDGEFLAVLGPSGCGKTTLLRLIAGFEAIDSGTLAFDGRTMSAPGRHVPPEDRRVGIVFQSYALWPHMTVARNVGYALEVAGVGGDAYRTRVAAALASVGLSDHGTRRPAERSGGQRQRVALARCLAMEPALVLLDEPLANLDVHLRAAMLDEFAAFHDKSGATMVYITHDQEEAMALADRIAVMDGGRLVQAADPRTLYREPASAMVGGFVGRGAVVPATVLAVADGRAEVELLGARARLRCAAGQRPGAAMACLRPEDLSPAPHGAPGSIAGTIARATFRGAVSEIDVAAAGAVLRIDLPEPQDAAVGAPFALTLRDGWVIPGA